MKSSRTHSRECVLSNSTLTLPSPRRGEEIILIEHVGKSLFERRALFAKALRLETRGQALSHKKKGPDPKALTMVGRELHASHFLKQGFGFLAFFQGELSNLDALRDGDGIFAVEAGHAEFRFQSSDGPDQPGVADVLKRVGV